MTANATQVGGSHYKTEGKPEHWDLVLLYDWDYFQGQITKYLMRWKFKGKNQEARLDDLRKARHFLDKYIEAMSVELPEEPKAYGYINQDGKNAEAKALIERELAKNPHLR